MEAPTVDVDLSPERIENEKEGGPMFHCDLHDTEVVHKLAQMFLPGLASACVDHTTGAPFNTPGSVADDMRKEMKDYLTQRSESFVAESVILDDGADGEVSDHPFDIISCFVDDFVDSKRNLLSQVSGWLLSDKREDKIDDFVQEMETNGFWLLDKRQKVAENLLKNVDFKNLFHCSASFINAEDLDNHFDNCNFRAVVCNNVGCNARFSAVHLKEHDEHCPFKIIPCEQKCTDNIMRRDMDRHCITVCPMKLVNCPFYAVGCRSAIAQCMVGKHCSDDLQSHLLHLLKGIHKDASGGDLNRRVELIVQASSSNRLAEARDLRALKSIVRDIEAKLGPLEVSVIEKTSAKTVAKNEDAEDIDTKTKGDAQALTSSDKAEESATSNKNGADNAVNNEEDNEHKENGKDDSAKNE
ncbi:hypothetical protein L195_g019162 [Trifolium pratense]|uniref:TRAF-type domain-containing protein n=3 Tax=Trifolium pratense TaxID=57577 RepID=A0A2K3MYV2_TRIPR|nr:TNF receptor-associated factor family protein DDB_G0290931-like isoform X2 [Trifolium pratense]PNX95962.1 hypothetical protein L195_g019162 [Trifolium pratense]